MRTQERHHLKQNEFAIQAGKVADVVQANRSQLLLVGGVIALIVIVGGGYYYMTSRTADRASALLGAAITIQQGQIVPAPTVPGAKQQTGTYPTEQARADAATAAFQKVIDEFPSAEAGHAARYHMAGLQLQLGKAAEAERMFGEVVSRAGSSIYGSMAQLGRAQALSALGKHDEAIKILTDLSGQRDSSLPIDGVLMELARACDRAGKAQEARAAYKRVVDEFPQSGYANEARQKLGIG